ncbi:hypothetical protein [Streptomyces sp. NPDC088789]|uniref:hypothetical protein n=1 Tax=Streptomyces sp. NPDC088789 TaxID=3365899 RepID=UPI00382BBA10
MNTLTLTTGGHHITLHTDTAHITDWARTYFTAHWPEAPEPATATGPLVTALHHGPPLDHDRPHTHHTVYARDHLTYTPHPDGTVTARNRTHPALTYRYTPAHQHLEITHTGPDQPDHHDPCTLATATTRFTRHLLHAQLTANGWTLLHASAAIHPTGHGVLALGGPGAGKTTTALTLATTRAALLATDCCYARPNPRGTLDLLPWPAATTIGLGLLDALGWTSTVRERLKAGEPPHPTQHPSVTHALTTGTTRPLYAADGRERKAQLWPHQLQHWFRLTLTPHATADRILQTRIDPAADTPRTCPPEQPGHDVFTTGPGRYPDIFGLTHHQKTPAHRQQVVRHLRTLPHHSLILGHQHSTNTMLIHQTSTSAPVAQCRPARPFPPDST